MTAISQPITCASDEPAHEHAHEELGFLKTYLFSTDHKTIGIQFLMVGLMFFVIGGLLAMLVRWELGWPNLPVPILGAYMEKIGAWSGRTMPDDFYNAAFTMHASIMIFFVIIPILVGVYGNYLIPLKIGAADMAFPFLNGIAFWSAIPAGAIMVSSFFLPGGPAAAGWTSYPPLSRIEQHSGRWAAEQPAPYTAPATPLEKAANDWDRAIQTIRIQDPAMHRQGVWPSMALVTTFGSVFLLFGYLCCYRVRLGNCILNFLVGVLLSAVAAILILKGIQYATFDGQSAWFLSLTLLGFSSIMGAINYLTTIIKLRCPGMTMFRLPLSVWSLFITSILVLLATPVLAAALTMNLLDHNGLTSFFIPFNRVVTNQLQPDSGGGYALLHQHLFWFYSHPAVYIMILPAMGMVSDILAVGAASRSLATVR